MRAIASTLREQLTDTAAISNFAIPVPGTGGGLEVRVTAGCASSHHEDLDGLDLDPDLDGLIRAADAELYARRAGRRSQCAEPPGAAFSSSLEGMELRRPTLAEWTPRSRSAP